MNHLTVTLITRDEESDMPRALASVAGIADEIVVVDSGSRDRTCDVARAAGAKVVTRDWTDYSDQKNFAASLAAHDWILNLDADEEPDPRLRTSLAQWKDTQPEAVAYWMRRKACYLGRWILHSGWYPDPKLRLYRKDKARFVGTVHESLTVEGPTAWLEGELLHYTMNTLEDHLRKTRRYSALSARQLAQSGRRGWLLYFLFAPPWEFFRRFLLQQGFLDGTRGILIAAVSTYYVFLKYWKLGILLRGGTILGEDESP